MLEVSFLILACLFMTVIFLFHQRNIITEEKTTNAVAPVSGKIKSIVQLDDFTDIEIVMPWWGEMGVYLPFHSELKNKVKRRGEAFFRHGFSQKKIDRRGVALMLRSIDDFKVWEMIFEECSLGGRPRIAISPGDRGLQGASMGYFLFGGIVRIRFASQDFLLLVRRGETLVAGKTPLCCFLTAPDGGKVE